MVFGVVNRQQKHVKLLEKYVKTVIVSRLIFMGFKSSSKVLRASLKHSEINSEVCLT